MLIKDAIINRMSSGEPFTFQDLWLPHGIDAGYRLADRLIQKWRKAGLISFARVGRLIIWSLTDYGKEYVETKLKPTGE